MRTNNLMIRMLLGLMIGASLAQAGSAPALVNYQGVLRDAAGKPVNGNVDMTFRFFNTAVQACDCCVAHPTTGCSSPICEALVCAIDTFCCNVQWDSICADEALGFPECAECCTTEEILIDRHLAGEAGPVGVSGGLFSVALGSGAVSDGSGGGTYTTLAKLFRDFPEVYMQVEVNGEVLTPRIRLLSAAYALNAAHLEGRSAAEFIDTSANTQTKAGDLEIGGQLTIGGGNPGTGRVLTSDAGGTASWQDPPGSGLAGELKQVAELLGHADPHLPETLHPLDCSGPGAASLVLSVGGQNLGNVIGFIGHDQISTPYAYHVAVESGNAGIDAELQIGQNGRLTFQRDGLTTTFSGTVTQFGLAGVSGGTATYVVKLEPALTRLRRDVDYRVFQEISDPDLLTLILNEAAISNYQFQLTASYEPAEMAVQYRESDLNFLDRVSERSGMHYHFEEGPVQELMVLGDSNASFPSIGTVSYLGHLADPGPGTEIVTAIHTPTRQFTQSATTGGYDFELVNLIYETVTLPGGTGENYRFEAEAVRSSSAAQFLSNIETQREDARRQEGSGTSNAPDLKAGHAVTLQDQTPANAFSGNYVVTQVDHFLTRNGADSCWGYVNEFKVVRSPITYRPPRRTPRPNVHGPITATVTGKAGEEIWVDQYGRIKVQFHWDRYGQMDENSSAWLRVVTPVGGTDAETFIPKIGTEVLVTFVNGDPRQPIVIGSLYNGGDLPPVPLP